MIRKNIYFLIILTLLSGVTHFLFFGSPSTVVFDEVYFGKYASDYIVGSYYFDPHPPLGKLLIRGAGYLGGVNSDTTDYRAIGNAFEAGPRISYRLLPALAGTLLAPVIFLLLLALGFSSPVAFVGGLLVIFENSLLVQARFVSLDSMLLLFGFTSLLWYFLSRKVTRAKKYTFLVLSAFFSALTLSIKWTGLAYPLIIALCEMIEVVDWKRKWFSFKKMFGFLSVYSIFGLVVYLSVFAIHFSYLRYSGQGNEFMSDRFQKTLLDSAYTNEPAVKPKAFFGKFFELNLEMLEVNKHMNATHQYSSKWFTWPLMTRGVFYWQGIHDGVGNRYLYFLGNPLIYWVGTFSILFLLGLVVFKKRRDKIALCIIIGFLANFIPYIFIGRVMFLYHYQAALVFSIMALCYHFENMVSEQNRRRVMYGFLGLCIISFLFFSPLTYGFYLSDAALHARMWVPSWR